MIYKHFEYFFLLIIKKCSNLSFNHVVVFKCTVTEKLVNLNILLIIIIFKKIFCALKYYTRSIEFLINVKILT